MLLFGLVACAVLAVGAAARPPIALHPENPRYFLFRGRPTVLITSGEHYGAVLNRDFDYARYLDTLKAAGYNLTRTFAGSYVEVPGTFAIAGNTLAPADGRFVCPWARSETPGYARGGARFDLRRWDPAYFARLTDFCRQAGRRGIVVEIVPFCPFYDEGLWRVSPMNAANNVNGIGAVAREEALTLQHSDLVEVQERLLRKLSEALAGFDNVYFEVCNEPYVCGVPEDWQDHMAAVLAEAESARPRPHLIARNWANGSARIDRLRPHISIHNFHYAWPPRAVELNAALRQPIAFDETGFRGTADLPYRSEAWAFLMAGGAVYSNLDYSFTAGHEDGSFVPPPTQPGGGGPSLRAGLSALKRFVERLDIVRMAPAPPRSVPDGVSVWALSDRERAWALYALGGGEGAIVLVLPAGSYTVEWVDPSTGAVVHTGVLRHPGGEARLAPPPHAEDIAARIRRRGGSPGR